MTSTGRASAPRCDFRVFRRGGRWSWCGRSGSGSCSATPPPLLLWRHRRCTRCTLPLLRVPHPLPRPDVQLRYSPPLSLSAERRSSLPLPLPRRRRLRWPRRRGTARPEADGGTDGRAGGGTGTGVSIAQNGALAAGLVARGPVGQRRGREDGGRTEKKGRLSSLACALSVPLASF